MNMYRHMFRRAQHDSQTQYPLAFDSGLLHVSHSPLRVAYERLRLSHQLTFEQAMSIPPCAIGIRNLAVAMIRSERKRRQVPLTREG
jgi:hypothetical protein